MIYWAGRMRLKLQLQSLNLSQHCALYLKSVELPQSSHLAQDRVAMFNQLSELRTDARFLKDMTWTFLERMFLLFDASQTQQPRAVSIPLPLTPLLSTDPSCLECSSHMISPHFCLWSFSAKRKTIRCQIASRKHPRSRLFQHKFLPKNLK